MPLNYDRHAAVYLTDDTETELLALTANQQFNGWLYVCNQSQNATTISVAITDASGAADSEDWIYYFYAVAANDVVKIGVSIGNSKNIRVAGGAVCAISVCAMGMLIT